MKGVWAEEVSEKGLNSFEAPEMHAGAAETHVDLIGFVPGINPLPTARMSFPAGGMILNLITDWVPADRFCDGGCLVVAHCTYARLHHPTESADGVAH